MVGSLLGDSVLQLLLGIRQVLLTLVYCFVELRISLGGHLLRRIHLHLLDLRLYMLLLRRMVLRLNVGVLHRLLGRMVLGLSVGVLHLRLLWLMHRLLGLHLRLLWLMHRLLGLHLRLLWLVLWLLGLHLRLLWLVKGLLTRKCN